MCEFIGAAQANPLWFQNFPPPLGFTPQKLKLTIVLTTLNILNILVNQKTSLQNLLYIPACLHYNINYFYIMIQLQTLFKRSKTFWSSRLCSNIQELVFESFFNNSHASNDDNLSLCFYPKLSAGCSLNGAPHY